MTNTISIWLALLIAVAIGLDWYAFDWSFSIYLGRKMLEFIEYLAFWR